MLKRSQIDRVIGIAIQVFNEFGMRLPPFAFMTANDWEKAGHEYDEIRDCMLGWDVTDFGMNDFTLYGRVLFTLRNGKRSEKYPKSYAEKFILDPEGQRAPEHYHKSKREDIINRGTGFIAIDLSSQDDKPLKIAVDGISQTIPSKSRVMLKPGESIQLAPGMIHSFWGDGGNGIMIDGVRYGASGEVSTVCDDINDNFFLNRAPRFSEIEEDVSRQYCLCREYPSPCGVKPGNVSG